MGDLTGHFSGRVVARDDPRKIGRVKVEISGVAEPTPWALPTGAAGAGRGDWCVPDMNAEVVVFFEDGDPDSPYYLRGNFAEVEVPPEVVDGSPDIRVIASKNYVVVMDDRGPDKLSIIHRPSGDVVTHDGSSLSLAVRGVTKLSITSSGLVDIRGAVVMIQGRTVVPGPKPI